MRRILQIGIALAAIAFIAVVIAGSSSSTSYRVDALFHTANGMVAGQNVDVAGAKVGTVTAVQLLRTTGHGYQARLELSINPRFKPFHGDASCRILPQSIIGEDYVDCSPGTSTTLLPRGLSGAPTVGLAHTAAPLNLQSLLDTFAAPAPERLSLLVDELGIATAGEGANLAAILQQSNPALTEVNRVLTIIDHQRDQVARAVTQTNQVLTQLASRTDDVRGFVDHAASVAETTASQAFALSTSIKQLPGTLNALRGALAPVRRITQAGIPLLDELRAAAPDLDTLTYDAPAFFKPAVPAVEAFSAAVAVGRKAIGPATPVARDLATFSGSAQPFATLLDRLLVAGRASGMGESLLDFVYAFAAGTSGYDNQSHSPLAVADVWPTCVLENLTPNTPDSRGCSHAYSAPNLGHDIPPQAPTSSTGQTRGIRASKSDVAQLSSLLRYILK